MGELKDVSLRGLLALHSEILEELRRRGLARSANSPTGSLAEYLFCRASAWEQAPNSKKGFDATDAEGTRYQIKGRRLHKRNQSCQLSAIRDVDRFDVPSAALFDEQYRVFRAALIPREVVRRRSRSVPHTNSYRSLPRGEVWDDGRVKDVTVELRAVESSV